MFASICLKYGKKRVEVEKSKTFMLPVTASYGDPAMCRTGGPEDYQKSVWSTARFVFH